jgi:hypothetical protein
MKKTTGLALGLLLAVSLIGCGGGGGGGGDAASGGAALSGKVIDGPISGATVCLDVNSNNACDTGEPTVITDATGNYTLPRYSGSLDGLHILSIVPVGAIDLDTNTAVTDAYVMLAPASHPSFVTPLTTLVSAQMLANPSLSATAAEQATIVTNRLVAQTSSVLGVDVTQNSALHKIAQATATAMGKVQSTLTANNSFTTAASASNNGTSASQAATQAIRLTQSGLLQSMQKSDGSLHSSFVNNGTLNANAVNTLVSNAVNSSIDGLVASTLVGKSTNMDMASALSAGMTGFKIANGGHYIDSNNNIATTNGRHYKVERMSTSGNNGNFRNVGGTWYRDSQTFFDLIGGTWVAETQDGASNGGNTTPSITGNCFTAAQTPQGINLTACATGVNLSGKKLSDFGFSCNDPSGNAIGGCSINSVFPANSVGYNLQVSYDDDQYQINVQSVLQGGPSMSAFIGYLQTAGNYVSPTGNCSIVITVASYDSSSKQGVINWINNTSNSCNNLSNTIGAMTISESTPFKVQTVGSIEVLLTNYANVYYQNTGSNDETLLFGSVPANVSGNNTAGIYMGNFYSSKRTVNLYFGMSAPNMMNATGYNFVAGQYQLPALP